MMSDAFLILLQKMLRFWPIERIGVKDILFDPATLTVSLTGDALSLELRALNQMLANPDNSFDYDWARTFGIPIEKTQYGTRPKWFMDENHISDFVEMLGSAIRDAYMAMTDEDLGDEAITVQINPAPGYPWTQGKTTSIYSAKRKKWFKAETPPWLVRLKRPEGEVAAVDFCMISPRLETGVGAEIGVIGDAEFMVTHAAGLIGEHRKAGDETLKLIAHCGGLLFPSLATGIIPATNFGETVFVIDPAVAVASMRPYRKRGAWHVVTYSSDVWTETLRELVMNSSVEAFTQLHGRCNLTYTDHFYVLGPEVKEEAFGGKETKPITATSKLASVLRRKFKMWRRDMTLARFSELSNVDTPDRYGYLETKVHGIVDWKLVRFVVAPRRSMAEVSAQVAAAGYKGKLIGVDVDDAMFEAFERAGGGEVAEYLRYQYAWLVADAIRQAGYIARIEEG